MILVYSVDFKYILAFARMERGHYALLRVWK